jgi:methionine sulfoxide reductase heme-binding subunit
VNAKALWYLTRGSGIALLLLLTASVLLGILTSTKWARERWPRFVVEGLHRNLSLMSTVFLFVHIASAVVDSYVSIRWIDAIVPFGAAYKPFWLGIGALSLDLLAAVAITSLLRRRLTHRLWRRVHWMAYGSWALAVVHGLGIGSDRHQTWLLAMNVSAVGAVSAATIWRAAVTIRNRPIRVQLSTTQGALR